MDADTGDRGVKSENFIGTGKKSGPSRPPVDDADRRSARDAGRVRALHGYGILDTPPEAAFDELAALAARICGTPISLVSLVDRDRQWFMAHHGVALTETPRAVSFCTHALDQPGELMIVPDAARDPRFADNPWVTSEPRIRFYAGMPLCTPDGHAIGALCVFDRQPRTLSPDQQEALRVLGRQVMAHLELHRVTRRRLEEAAMRESEERYRLRMTFSSDAQFVHVGERITAVNPAFCQLLGAQQEGQLVGKRLFEVVHPDCHELVRERLQSVRRGQLVAPVDEKFVRLDGSVVEVEVGAVAIDFRGRQEVHVIVRDITVRKHAEEFMREKTAFLEAQVNASPDGILVVDSKGTKVLQNQRFLELLQVPADLANENDDEKTLRFVTGLMRNPNAFIAKVLHLYAHPDETSSDEVELKDGTMLERYSSPVRGKGGKTYGRIWTFRDITARQAAERALRESEERFKFVARAISDVVWDRNLAANTLWWNDGFLTTFGFVAGEIEPSVESWTSRIHPDDRGRVVGSIREAVDADAHAWNAEYRSRRKDGTYALVQDRAFILRDAAGKAVRMVGGMRDLTEEKMMEARYLRAQRLDGIGALAGGIAHDLNNVLAPIMMSIELLKLDASNDAHRRKILDIIQVSSRRGADLVRQVLTFARGQDGERIAIRLPHLIDDLREMISETFPRNIAIATQLPAGLWSIIGDATGIHQVLLNLAVNARDAMPDGGSLTVTATNVVLDAQSAGTNPAAKAGKYVLLQVSDTGRGMPPEIRARIFEPFFTTKKAGKGTGLGLATVHDIVKSHGGFASVASEVGIGTTFNVYLPADPDSRTAGSAPPFQIELPRGQDELVLVVDDESSIRHITQQTLEAFGYRVITAGDGAEAVALFAQQAGQIAVVLIDMMMPILDGAKTIAMLREINPAVRIISASGLEAAGEAAPRSGASALDFLAKPYTAETLVRRIRHVLDRPAPPDAKSGAALARPGGPPA